MDVQVTKAARVSDKKKDKKGRRRSRMFAFE
jgi:hypothetical protein